MGLSDGAHMLHRYRRAFFHNQKGGLVESNTMVGRNAEKLNMAIDGRALLIVSDHSMRRGVHTNHGFWGANTKLPFEPWSITDFYRIIARMLQDDSE